MVVAASNTVDLISDCGAIRRSAATGRGRRGLAGSADPLHLAYPGKPWLEMARPVHHTLQGSTTGHHQPLWPSPRARGGLGMSGHFTPESRVTTKPVLAALFGPEDGRQNCE